MKSTAMFSAAPAVRVGRTSSVIVLEESKSPRKGETRLHSGQIQPHGTVGINSALALIPLPTRQRNSQSGELLVQVLSSGFQATAQCGDIKCETRWSLSRNVRCFISSDGRHGRSIIRKFEVPPYPATQFKSRYQLDSRPVEDAMRIRTLGKFAEHFREIRCRARLAKLVRVEPRGSCGGPIAQ